MTRCRELASRRPPPRGRARRAAVAARAPMPPRRWLASSPSTIGSSRLEPHMREVERLIEILRTREREGEGSRFDRLARRTGAPRHASACYVRGGSARRSARDGLGHAAARCPLTRLRARRGRRSRPSRRADALFTRATSTRAELRALQHLAERATFEADAARRARLPSPTLFGGVKRADELSGRQNGGVFGLSVSVPLFDAGGREAASGQPNAHESKPNVRRSRTASAARSPPPRRC